ncbi:MAG: hypothetical protein K6A63_06445 [Acholeplasmatales bacterium]|nr:hypothetical protein [Acholeplasmatales bacterium]
MRFNLKFLEHYKSIELFSTEYGFNYITDALTLEPAFQRFYEMDGLVVLLLNSEDLDEADGKYIHNMGCKIKHENNVLIYHYNYGKKRTLPSIHDLEVVFRNLEFLESLIKNEPTLTEGFNANKMALSQIDTEKLEYKLTYKDIPYLEYLPKKARVNQALVDEYKDSIYSPDEAYLLTTFYTMVIKETGVRPLIVTYIQGRKMFIKYIMTAPKTYKDLIYGIMDSIWTEAGVLPEVIHIDSREFYKALESTLDALHIEYDFFRNVPTMTNFEAFEQNATGIRSLKPHKEKPGDRDSDTDIHPKELIEGFLKMLTQSISNLSKVALEDISEYDLEEEFDDDSDSDSDEYATNMSTDTDYIA